MLFFSYQYRRDGDGGDGLGLLAGGRHGDRGGGDFVDDIKTGGDVANETIFAAAVRTLAGILALSKHAPTQAMALRASAVLGRAFLCAPGNLDGAC